jgi:hypothetical protein
MCSALGLGLLLLAALPLAECNTMLLWEWAGRRPVAYVATPFTVVLDMVTIPLQFVGEIAMLAIADTTGET